MASILALHGPNLNLLGEREPDVYGHATLADINQRLEQIALDRGHHLLAMQSNAEYELIERIRKLTATKAPAHRLHQGNSGATPHLASIGG